MSDNLNAQHLKELVKRELNASERDISGDKGAKAGVETIEEAFCFPDISNGIHSALILSKLHVLLDNLEGAAYESLASFRHACCNKMLNVHVKVVADKRCRVKEVLAIFIG